MTLYLHIGTEKTASTFLQNKIVRSKKSLLEQGMGTLKSLNTPNNQYLPFLFVDSLDRDSFFRRVGIHSHNELADWREKIFRNIENEIEKIDSPNYIISSEHLQSCLWAVEEIRALSIYLNEKFKDVKVIVYLRDQLATAVSRWSTQIKSASPVFKLERPDTKRLKIICDHYTTLCKWGEIFGRENIIYRLYDKHHLYNSCIAADFENILKIKFNDATDEGFKSNDDDNVSMSLLEMKTFAQVASLRDFKSSNHLYSIFKEILRSRQVWCDNIGKHGYIPSIEEIDMFHEAFKDCNEQLNQVFFDGSVELWPSSSKLHNKLIRMRIDETIEDINKKSIYWSQAILSIVNNYEDLLKNESAEALYSIKEESKMLRNIHFRNFLRDKLSALQA